MRRSTRSSTQVPPLSLLSSQMLLSPVQPSPEEHLDADAAKNDSEDKEQPVETFAESSVVSDCQPSLHREPYGRSNSEEFDAIPE